jgi:RNA polymerase sigma-70 factor (ECF subfamily)
LEQLPGRAFVCDQAKPTTWLATIARKVLADARSKERRHVGDEDAGVEHAASTPDPFESAVARSEIAWIQQVLDEESEGHRAAFVLYELDEMTCAEIAEVLGIPVNTVYTRLNAVRRRILQRYQGLGDPNE